MKRLAAIVCAVSLLAACATVPERPPVTTGSGSSADSSMRQSSSGTGTPAASGEWGNLEAIQTTYGFTLTKNEQAFLEKNNFLIKNVTETNITPSAEDSTREFHDLYAVVRGNRDYKERTQANAVFYSSDVFFNSFNLLFTELMKEMENTTFYPAMKDLSAEFFKAAQTKAAAATGAEKEKWIAVRNYFAVPHALFSTARPALTTKDYDGKDANGEWLNPVTVMEAFKAEDKGADTYEKAAAFVKTLKLDADGEGAVLADLKTIFASSDKGVPKVFQDEYAQYATDTKVTFEVDFTQFTPRSHYTGTSLRREYFRGMNWFIQVPFFLKNNDLTTYAFAIAQLMAEHPDQAKNYDKLESMINFLVGTSDDLMPADYLAALAAAKGKTDQEAASMEYLIKAKQPKIKSLAATYDDVGVEDSADVLLKTKGMRLFSGKFIIDSYWTGMLTQGDEKPRPGYSQKLPPMASSLEVMALLGSDYAKSKIPTLDFYKPENSKAIDQMMAQLATEKAALGKDYWEGSVYGSSLQIIEGMFAWEKANKAKLPAFMRSDLWPVKTLRTAAGFWTEMRHAVLLYAKQSFAEKGGGPSCDDRKIPAPPKGYVEPQVEVYGRLLALATKLRTGVEAQNPNLRNLEPLANFEDLMTKVKAYAEKEIANGVFVDGTITEHRNPDEWDETKTCVSYTLDGVSDWEDIRNLVDNLRAALPVSTDTPILSAKDRRAALVADVHTGGDSPNPTRILYEGTGVPSLILVAINDANGPRVAAGFTYSQYEFTEPYGGKRMTDESWQKKFYKEAASDFDAYLYLDAAQWPKTPPWYDAILNVK